MQLCDTLSIPHEAVVVIRGRTLASLPLRSASSFWVHVLSRLFLGRPGCSWLISSTVSNSPFTSLAPKLWQTVKMNFLCPNAHRLTHSAPLSKIAFPTP